MEQLKLTNMLMGVEICTTALESSLVVAIGVEPTSPCDPAILHLGLYPRETYAHVHRGTCTEMFAAVCFAIAQAANNSNAHQQQDR